MHQPGIVTDKQSATSQASGDFRKTETPYQVDRFRKRGKQRGGHRLLRCVGASEYGRHGIAVQRAE